MAIQPVTYRPVPAIKPVTRKPDEESPRKGTDRKPRRRGPPLDPDVGENLDWIGHAIIDAEMRILCGLPQAKDPKIPFYIFDKANADDAGHPPALSKGYGDAYIEGYAKTWMLK